MANIRSNYRCYLFVPTLTYTPLESFLCFFLNKRSLNITKLSKTISRKLVSFYLLFLSKSVKIKTKHAKLTHLNAMTAFRCSHLSSSLCIFCSMSEARTSLLIFIRAWPWFTSSFLDFSFSAISVLKSWNKKRSVVGMRQW